MDQSAIDHIESLIIAATIEVMAALDRGATGECLDSAVEFVGHVLFVEVATRSRSVDAAETAVQRFADRVASIQLCEACQRHRINGRCVTCVAAADVNILSQSTKFST